MKILITGASGFVGRHLYDFLDHKGILPVALLRTFSPHVNFRNYRVVEDFLETRKWEEVLQGVDAVIHTAGLAHVKGRPDKDYYIINTDITEKLALECAKNGIKRLVYVSSTHVHVASSSPYILSPSSPYHPVTAYGKSKLLAEKTLREIEKSTGLEVVIVRPPLVYGPQAAGNIKALAKAIQKGVPFPFSGINNQRDLIYVENLADALMACAIHPAAKGKTFLVSDDHSVSIGELIRGLAQGLQKNARLFPMPESLLKLPFRLLKKEDVLEKIVGSLRLDISDIKNSLGWKPPAAMEEGLVKTGRSFC